MALAPGPVVTGAPRIQLPYGLFSVLAPQEGSADRWQIGSVTWESLSCDPIEGYAGPQCDDSTIAGLPRELVSSQGEDGDATSFTVYGTWACSPIPGGQDEATAQARLALTSKEQVRVEQALWSGDLGNVPNFMGANGYTAPINIGSGDVQTALALVEQGIANQYGSLGVIHMSRYTAVLLKSYLESRGGRMFTRLGTPVVVGGGYPNVPQIVGTPALFGYRSEIQDLSNRDYDLMDLGQNDLVAIAERDYLIGFDPCPIVTATYTEGGGGDVDPATLQRITDLETDVTALQAEGTPTLQQVLESGSSAEGQQIILTDDQGNTAAFGPSGFGALTATTSVQVSGTAAEIQLQDLSTGESTFIHAGDVDLYSAPGVGNRLEGAVGGSGLETVVLPDTAGQLALESDVVQSVVAGTGIAVDNTDPNNPIVATA